MKKQKHVPPGDRKKILVGLLRDNARRHRMSKVFSDFCEMSALMIANSCDPKQAEGREARFAQIKEQYQPDELERFAEGFAVLSLWLDEGFADCLGELFMSLELGDNFKGQFFSPFPLSRLMAAVSLTGAAETIEQQGFIRMCEPACGSGGMVIAAAAELAEQEINFQETMHVVAQDIDATAVHMCFIQLALWGIPAIVIHGNTLAGSKWAHWVTPMHVLGCWDFRLARLARRQLAAPVPELVAGQDQPPEAPAAHPEPATVSDALANARDRVVIERSAQIALF